VTSSDLLKPNSEILVADSNLALKIAHLANGAGKVPIVIKQTPSEEGVCLVTIGTLGAGFISVN